MPVAQQKGSEKDACKTEACSIQTCLSQNGYDVSRCSHQIDRLRKCCEQHQVRLRLCRSSWLVWAAEYFLWRCHSALQPYQPCFLLQGTSVHCGWDPSGLQGSAAGEPADQSFHGR